MKKILSLLLLCVSAFSFAQQNGTVTLDWVDNSAISYGEYKVRMPFVKSGNFHYDEEKQQVFFKMTVPQSAPVAENSLQITNVSYESVSLSQLGDLRGSALPNDINPTIKSVKARDKFFAHISLALIIKDGSGFKRVKSFTYTINASASRSAMLPGNTSAITSSVLANGDWYRFFVEKSGVYKISKSFLQSLGMNVSVDPTKLKIYGNGGRMLPLANSVAYPFDLVENAIQVVGEADGTFDSQDYILFYAEGVDNYSTESETNNNLYADRSYYYVTVKGDNGKRIPAMDPLSGSLPSVTASLNAGR